ncbi:hypothetical protein FSP39_002603 [Pinctada imbricata]|uniref:Guanylate cyclase n=1 Tax=Pinctada imbricata TaxID=66713 RepID=A0AA89BIL8_PINIB|nr:hypothetical protein FSP39_002603 [Pinctada imbricata]
MVGKTWSNSSTNLTESLKTHSIKGISGNVYIKDNRKAKRTFHLVHYQNNQFEIVANLSDSYEEVDKIEWIGGQRPRDIPECGFSGTECPQKGFVLDDYSILDHAGMIVGTCVGAIAAILAVISACFIYRKLRFEKELKEMLWKVDQSDIKLRKSRQTNAIPGNLNSGLHPKKKLVRMETRGTLGFGSSCSLDRNLLYAPIGNYKGSVVAVKSLQRSSFRLSRGVLRDLKTLRDLHHDNINHFVGASMEPQNSFILTRYCSKGSLQDILENDDIKLDWMFKMSFTLDLARGMEFVHKSPLRSHGNLKSSNCVIDSRWVLKITDFGAISTEIEEPALESAEHEFYNSNAFLFMITCYCVFDKIGILLILLIFYKGLLWTAPELLRLQHRPAKGSQRGDVYSFGIIQQEIYLRATPFFFNDNVSSSKEVINRIRKIEDPPYRPFIPSDSNLPDKSLTLMSICWHENPESRPDFHNIRKRLVDLNKGKKTNIMDNMIQMLEAYSNNLEQLVTERTEELATEKQKTDRLLYTMLPPLVAEQLKRGESVRPECYDEVSIFFSDIVGFTTIANESEPLQVVDLLNDLYTTFDDIIARHDIYKVETIGDAYMCVSGLPRRNGKRHTGEIANMALDLLSAVTNFKIRHKPHTKLQLRVGLHTGGCAAGVVGTAMPRYCLFGDTVNMASRMESTGKALHVHISADMNSALHDLQWGFMTLERGIIEVKKWRTYSETGRPTSPTESHISDKDHSDSMYGRAFRKTSIAIRFLHSLSHDNSPQGSRSTSELSVQDLNVSCDSVKEGLNPPTVEHQERGSQGNLIAEDSVCHQSLEPPDSTPFGKARTPKFAFAIPKIEIS